MSRVYTYSFEDTNVVISHPNFGSYSAYGTGIGSVAISYADDMTSHDVAADLAVVVNKRPVRTGTISFEVLQSSDFNDWLKKFATYIEEASVDQWALATISVYNKSTNERYFATGVSHQKRPDNSFNATAGRRTWNMMCANIANS